jgi:nucleotidyltransferase substrate binding protein (TIGR01987 family)
VIKEAFKAKTIKDGQEWINMLEDRNKTSHLYDEKQALKIYEKIKKNHYKILENFNIHITKTVENLEE